MSSEPMPMADLSLPSSPSPACTPHPHPGITSEAMPSARMVREGMQREIWVEKGKRDLGT